MKKNLFILFCFLTVSLFSQGKKVSDLAEATSISDNDVFYLGKSGSSYKVKFSTLGASITVPNIKIDNSNGLVGYMAGTSMSGSNNFLIGRYAGNNLSGSNNNIFGEFSGKNLSGSYNNLIGPLSGQDATMSFCTANGYSSLKNANCWYSNGIGIYSLFNNTGNDVNGFGEYAGYNNNKDNCLFNGKYSGYNSTGLGAIFNGPFSGYYNTGNYNLATGDSSLFKSSGNYITVYGNNSLTYGSDTLEGNRIISIGYNNQITDSSINDVGIFGNNISVDNDSSLTFDPAYKSVYFRDSTLLEIIAGNETVATPSGNNTYIQYNNNGDFGSNSGLTFTTGINELKTPNIEINGTIDSKGTISNSTGDVTVSDNLDISGEIVQGSSFYYHSSKTYYNAQSIAVSGDSILMATLTIPEDAMVLFTINSVAQRVDAGYEGKGDIEQRICRIRNINGTVTVDNSVDIFSKGDFQGFSKVAISTVTNQAMFSFEGAVTGDFQVYFRIESEVLDSNY